MGGTPPGFSGYRYSDTYPDTGEFLDVHASIHPLVREAFWLPTLGGAVRLANVSSQPWLALSILEGEHDTHAAVLTEGPAEVVATAPEDLRRIAELRNRGGSLEWATAWLRMTRSGCSVSPRMAGKTHLLARHQAAELQTFVVHVGT